MLGHFQEVARSSSRLRKPWIHQTMTRKVSIHIFINHKYFLVFLWFLLIAGKSLAGDESLTNDCFALLVLFFVSIVLYHSLIDCCLEDIFFLSTDNYIIALNRHRCCLLTLFALVYCNFGAGLNITYLEVSEM